MQESLAHASAQAGSSIPAQHATDAQESTSSMLEAPAASQTCAVQATSPPEAQTVFTVAKAPVMFPLSDPPVISPKSAQATSQCADPAATTEHDLTQTETNFLVPLRPAPGSAGGNYPAVHVATEIGAGTTQLQATSRPMAQTTLAVAITDRTAPKKVPTPDPPHITPGHAQATTQPATTGHGHARIPTMLDPPIPSTPDPDGTSPATTMALTFNGSNPAQYAVPRMQGLDMTESGLEQKDIALPASKTQAADGLSSAIPQTQGPDGTTPVIPVSYSGEVDSSGAIDEDDPLPRLLENRGLFHVIVACKEVFAGLTPFQTLPENRRKTLAEQAVRMFAEVSNRRCIGAS
eukprot:jgi/Botrbrau1/15153/Bobra.0149s0022.2